MTAKQRRTLQSVFDDPVRASIPWLDIEALFLSLGADRDEGSGSRIRFYLIGVRATFHRPHPQKETERGAVGAQIFVGSGSATMMEYKGYIGHVEYDDDAEIFHGEVINTRDVVTFQGENVVEIKQAFRDSVQDYLEYCAKLGQQPEKPFTGKFMLRIPPDLHRRVYVAAKQSGESINAWIKEQLTHSVERVG